MRVSIEHNVMFVRSYTAEGGIYILAPAAKKLMKKHE